MAGTVQYRCLLMETKRIGYIDAMRGFTMILVVYSHVCSYCLGDPSMGFNDVLFLFRLPCFFFISGWLFYKADRQWNRLTVRQVVSRKFMVQIVPTFIFLLLLVTIHDGQSPMEFFSHLGATKGGYWFTFALFEFFVLYILSALISRKRQNDVLRLCIAVVISFSAFCFDVNYHYLTTHPSPIIHPSVITILGFLSFITWRYYLFFFLGTLARKHFGLFLRLTDNRPLMIAAFVGFFIVACRLKGFFSSTIQHDSIITGYLMFAVGGVLGMIIVFTIFRRLSGTHYRLPKIHHPSKATNRNDSASPFTLTFVGRRTLDIYLLHYFFLPRFLLSYVQEFRSFNNPFLESAVALLLALLVTAVCLLVSYVIRLSPFLGHYLFGVDYERKKLTYIKNNAGLSKKA